MPSERVVCCRRRCFAHIGSQLGGGGLKVAWTMMMMTTTLHWHYWVKKKERRNLWSLSPFLLDSFPSLSPLFKNQSIVSLTVFLRVLIGFMPCSFAKEEEQQWCWDAGKEAVKIPKDLRGKERKKINYIFVFSANFFSFLFLFFLADVSASFVHPWINPITRWIDPALWSVEFKSPTMSTVSGSCQIYTWYGWCFLICMSRFQSEVL